MQKRHLLVFLFIGACASLVADNEIATDELEIVAETETKDVIILEESPPAEDATEEEKASYWEKVRQQYEAAKTKSMELVEKTRDATGEAYDKTKDAASDMYQGAKDAVGGAYDKTRDTTTGWYDGARSWTAEDIKKAGSWHYRVVVISKYELQKDPAKVEETLNELGAQRFECYWVEPMDDLNMAFFFKKSGFSYLKSLPAKELWRFIPVGGSDESGDDSGQN